MRVNITNHAMQRWCEFGQEKMRYTQLVALVDRHFNAALRQGIKLRGNAAYIDDNKDLVAVIVPGNYRWDVVTFRIKSGSYLRRFYYDEEGVSV